MRPEQLGEGDDSRSVNSQKSFDLNPKSGEVFSAEDRMAEDLIKS